MFVVNVDIHVKTGSAPALEQTFRSDFYPAISAQSGFSSAELLRSLENDSAYFLVLMFDKQTSQERWVVTDLHQKVWSQMESHFDKYVVTKFNTVER